MVGFLMVDVDLSVKNAYGWVVGGSFWATKTQLLGGNSSKTGTKLKKLKKLTIKVENTNLHFLVG